MPYRGIIDENAETWSFLSGQNVRFFSYEALRD
jgi:hypothetical protein